MDAVLAKGVVGKLAEQHLDETYDGHVAKVG